MKQIYKTIFLLIISVSFAVNTTLPPLKGVMEKLFGYTADQLNQAANHLNWQVGDTAYSWLGNGMLESVRTASDNLIRFEYDALGRRTAKIV